MELLKQRLLGALVLLSLAIIFVPEVFDEKGISVFLAETHERETLPYQLALAEQAGDAGHTMAHRVSAMVDSTNNEAWSVRVGAFSDATVAAHLKEKLHQQGYTAYIQTSDNNLYNVLVGPELAVGNAYTVQQQLHQHLDLKGVVVPYEPVLFVQSNSIQQG